MAMTITCSGCDRPIEFTGTLTERHTLVYCDECMAKAATVEIPAFEVFTVKFNDDCAACESVSGICAQHR